MALLLPISANGQTAIFPQLALECRKDAPSVIAEVFLMKEQDAISFTRLVRDENDPRNNRLVKEENIGGAYVFVDVEDQSIAAQLPPLSGYTGKYSQSELNFNFRYRTFLSNWQVSGLLVSELSEVDVPEWHNVSIDRVSGLADFSFDSYLFRIVNEHRAVDAPYIQIRQGYECQRMGHMEGRQRFSSALLRSGSNIEKKFEEAKEAHKEKVDERKF
jgi:hypothetical protein